MSGRDFQLPVGDRDFEDRRSERQYVRPPTAPVQQPGEGFVACLERLSKNPAIVPVYECFECTDSFNHEPVTDGEHHAEEAKRKGLTWCSVVCLRQSQHGAAVMAGLRAGRS